MGKTMVIKPHKLIYVDIYIYITPVALVLYPLVNDTLASVTVSLFLAFSFPRRSVALAP